MKKCCSLFVYDMNYLEQIRAYCKVSPHKQFYITKCQSDILNIFKKSSLIHSHIISNLYTFFLL